MRLLRDFCLAKREIKLKDEGWREGIPVHLDVLQVDDIIKWIFKHEKRPNIRRVVE